MNIKQFPSFVYHWYSKSALDHPPPFFLKNIIMPYQCLYYYSHSMYLLCTTLQCISDQSTSPNYRFLLSYFHNTQHCSLYHALTKPQAVGLHLQLKLPHANNQHDSMFATSFASCQQHHSASRHQPSILSDSKYSLEC